MKKKLQSPKLQDTIKLLNNQFCLEICDDHPNAFWDRKKHIVSLPYEEGFDENKIPTKARPCQMNSEYLELCKKEIESLLQKGLINTSKSPWFRTAFYSKHYRGIPRLVINYKHVNKILTWIRYHLKWIRYLIPNKKNLLDKLYASVILSKYNLKTGCWQIQIHKTDKYKAVITIPFGQFEWNII